MKTEVGYTVIVDVEGEVKLSGWGEREAGSGVRLLLLQELNPQPRLPKLVPCRSHSLAGSEARMSRPASLPSVALEMYAQVQTQLRFEGLGFRFRV